MLGPAGTAQLSETAGKALPRSGALRTLAVSCISHPALLGPIENLFFFAFEIEQEGVRVEGGGCSLLFA